MKTERMLADMSYRFLHNRDVHKYRMKKIGDMTDEEIISNCHFFCEENGLTDEWRAFREEEEGKYCFCSYLEEYINEGMCCDLQMISGGYINPSALPEIVIDKEMCKRYCAECENNLK